MFPRIGIMLALMVALTICAFAQKSGSITGSVRGAAGVTVIATNQVTSKVKRTRAGADGRYAMKLPAGAYHLGVELPYIAKFDEAKKKNYGEHALIRDDALENVIVTEGKEITIDFEVEKKEQKTFTNPPERKPLGAAGSDSVKSEPQTQPDRREVRDRWRIGFPEYDRYRDKGARGRDIPFNKRH